MISAALFLASGISLLAWGNCADNHGITLFGGIVAIIGAVLCGIEGNKRLNG